jgi:hypothetical protein
VHGDIADVLREVGRRRGVQLAFDAADVQASAGPAPAPASATAPTSVLIVTRRFLMICPPV